MYVHEGLLIFFAILLRIALKIGNNLLMKDELDNGSFKSMLTQRKSFFDLLRSFSSVQFGSVAQSCPVLCDPMDCNTTGLPVHHQLPEFTQIHVH